MTQSLKILLVEDDAVDRESVRRALMRSDIAVEVDEAVDVASGLAKLTEKTFDCAIVDYRLPDGDAWDFLDARDIKDQIMAEHYSEPPIVILTGQGSEKAAVDFLKGGACDYIPKSEVTPTRIGQSVRNAVRVAQMRRKTVSAFENLNHVEACCHYLFDSFPEALVLTDTEGRVIDANRTACLLCATAHEKLVGTNLVDAAPHDLREEARRYFLGHRETSVLRGEDVPWLSGLLSVRVLVTSRRTVSTGNPAILLHMKKAPEGREMQER